MTSEAMQNARPENEIRATLESMICDPGSAPAAIADLLDELDPDARPRIVRRLGRGDQRLLYAKVQGFRPVGLTDLVPPDRGDLVEVRHLGRNSLPAFTIFEKRFCRLPGSPADAPEALAGYNFQALSPITGPGYFMAVEDPATREVLVDYRRVPDRKPADWPGIRSNEKGLARFVYGFMVDRLRRVSEHVTIGSASRKGRELGSYFILCREA
ncbi:MAG TPA: hypothetical protein ENI85_16595 [Deltaproteobacteria bacterium]|nr:hypothetical protein [Deltaproteobacteria bacterium]